VKKFEWLLSVVLSMCIAEAFCIVLYWLISTNNNTTTAVVVLSCALVVSSIITVRLIRGFTNPWGKVVLAIKRLADGDYHFRTELGSDKFGLLVPYINELADKLERTKKSFENQKYQLNTLVENIGSPLVFIDKSGRMIHTNDLFIRMFHINHLFDQYFNDLMPYEEIKEIVDNTFRFQTTIRQQIVLDFSIERRHFDVYSAPILHKSGKLRGVVVVLHDITELKKLEKMRQDFVANVSHELRTPVTSIKGFAETLLEEEIETGSLHQKFLRIISTESDRLQNLINDLLELSKIEQEGFQLDWQTVDLKKVLEDTCLVLSKTAHKKEIGFNFSVEGSSLIKGDRYRLKQIMMNVINNAIAYSPSGSTIEISIKESRDSISCSIKDSGIGIDEKEIPRIFERFYRVDKARSRESGGTGLGLAIVKHLIEAHHASVAVKSKRGKGTTFEFSFMKPESAEV
jgi:two-component system, OmpR family, phosphate regulon sensor histidine kinase PhoR